MTDRDAKGRIRPKMGYADTRNAWMLYQAGYSTGWIAERLWRKFGHKNMRACQAALIRSFRYRQTRTHGEAARVRFANGLCKGCGCPYAERTKGCNRCHRRFSNKNRKGTVVAPLLRECAGCGCDQNERTYGCKTCSTRHGLRRRRAANRALASRSGLGGLSTGRVTSSSPRGGTSEGTPLPERSIA